MAISDLQDKIIQLIQVGVPLENGMETRALSNDKLRQAKGVVMDLEELTRKLKTRLIRAGRGA